MEYIIENWPFVPGQQMEIFRVSGSAIVGLIVLNLVSAIRQGLPVSKIFSSLFIPVLLKNKTETIIEIILVMLLIIGSLVLVLDITINGVQFIGLNN